MSAGIFALFHFRGGMVETDPQYELVYRALHHYWANHSASEDETHDIALEALFDD